MRALPVRGEGSPQKLGMGLQLKKIPYPTFDGKPAFAVYAISGDQCIFSGVTTSPPVTSTINAAEGIMAAIAGEQKRAITSLSFLDLQTHRGYRRREPGDFALDELVLKFRNGRLADVGWDPRECSPEIQDLFSPYISEPVVAQCQS